MSDYEFTCFLSYERHLDIDRNGSKTMSAAGEWVHEVLHPAMQKWLREECPPGQTPKIAFDGNFQLGDNSKQVVRDRLARSRVMVAVLSAPYFHSSWCLAEWRSMLAREKNHHQSQPLLLPIVFYDGKNFDEEAKARTQGAAAHAFRRYVTLRGSHVNSLLYPDFITEVQQLCSDIVTLAASAPPWSANFPWLSPAAAPDRSFELPSQQS